MGVSRWLASFASLMLVFKPARSLPFNATLTASLDLESRHFQGGIFIPHPDLPSPMLFRRDEPATPEPQCDRICVHRLLFQTTYSAVSMGIEYGMAVHKAQDWCSGSDSTTCGQILDSTTSNIASVNSYMDIDYDFCDDACLLVSMREVANRGALGGMKWADTVFGEEQAEGVDQTEVEKLHWTMWYLTEPEPSVSVAAVKQPLKESARPWNTTAPLSNATAAMDNSTEARNSTTMAGNNSTSNGTSTLNFMGASQNLLLGYVNGGACNDAYLCDESNRNYISGLLHTASSKVNGTTWLGYMLAGAVATHTESGRKPTFPEWATKPPCTGCPPPPDIGPQRPPRDWTPERITDPPTDPHVPDPPHGPENPVTRPLDEKDSKPPKEDDKDKTTDEDKQRQEEERKKAEEKQKELEDERKQKEELDRMKEDEKRKQREEEDKRRKEEDRREEEEQRAKEQKDIEDAKEQQERERKQRLAEEQRAAREEERRKAAEDERKAREEEDRSAKENEIRKAQEDEKRRIREEQEVQKIKDEEDRKAKEDQLEEERRLERKRKGKQREEIKQECQGERDVQKCVVDKNKKADEENERKEQESDRQLDEQRKTETENEIKKECGDDKKCADVKKEDAKARDRLDEEERKQEAERRIEKTKGKKSCVKGRDCDFPDPPHEPGVEPPEVERKKSEQRWRSTIYDPKDGEMRPGELQHHPQHKQRIFETEEDTTKKKTASWINDLEYEPFQLWRDGKDTGIVEWHQWRHLISTNDPLWINGGTHWFKTKWGQLARDVLGNAILKGPDGKAQSVKPMPGKKVRFEGEVKNRVLDAAGEVIRDRDGTEETLDVYDHKKLKEQIDWERVNKMKRDLDELGEDLDKLSQRWHPKEHVPERIAHEAHQLDPKKLEPFEHPEAHLPGPSKPKDQPKPLDPKKSEPWEHKHDPQPGPSKPKEKPGRLDPNLWPPSKPSPTGGPDPRGHLPQNDGADDSDLLTNEQIRKLKNGKYGKLPNLSKFPKIPQLNSITSVARYTGMVASAEAASGPVGWLVMFGTLGASEFLMMSEAEGNADVWWHCFKSRLNPFANHHCGAVDENGNAIETEDKGPFDNFIDNYYGWLKDKDIDGDGELENVFERFVAGMQDLGDAVYDFFDSSDDGKGVVENTVTLISNGVKTAVHVAEKGFNWVADKVEGAVEKVSKAYHGVKKFLKNLFGHDDDGD